LIGLGGDQFMMAVKYHIFSMKRIIQMKKEILSVIIGLSALSAEAASFDYLDEASTEMLRSALYEPLCIDLFEVG
jgi:hypothetical protein